MPEAKKRILRLMVHYGMAALAVGVAMAVRTALEWWGAGTLPTYITFYPVVMVVALLFGFGPGLAATLLSAIVVDYWVIESHEFFVYPKSIDAIGIALFLAMGAFMSVFAEIYRRNRFKAAAYDRAQALRETQEQHRLALEAADMGTWDYRFDIGRVAWDRRCREMWGLPDLETIDYTAAVDRICDEDRARVDGAVKAALAGADNGRYHQEFSITWPDGSAHWIASHGRVYFDGDGAARRAVRFVGADLDITQRKGTEEALRKTIEELRCSNQELEQFGYITSHDLQEPLRQVRSFTQLLDQRYGDKLDAKAGEFMRFIIEGAGRMSDLVQDLLTYSRLGVKESKRRDVSCQAALNRALVNLGGGIAESGARITHDELPTVSGDPTQLSQLFQNLVGNAVKFCREGVQPEIHVGCRREGGHWLLWVRDNGIGVDPEHHERVFQIFQRLHGRGKYAGTGIGLAICRKIVEWHGGRIWIESKDGQGATFFFTLPQETKA